MIAAAAAGRGSRALRWAPPLTIAAFGLPIVAGFAGTLLPAFGVLPSIEQSPGFSLASWRALFAAPGFPTSLALTLGTGLAATLLSVLIALSWSALVHDRRWARRVGHGVAPLLATPHSALAIGFAFLIAPSGWLARLVSPGLSGWTLPPDMSTVGHPSGWPLVACLLLKEVPYLMLMTLGALNQVPVRAHLAAARALGYGPVAAYVKVVLPQVHPQIRLPIYAVLAFSLSVVDVAIVLGPANPPTLSVLAVRWFADPDVTLYFQAAAAATLLFAIVVAAVGAWHAVERRIAAWGRRWVERGRRRDASTAVATVAGGGTALMFAAAAASMLGMALWSFADRWRFPDALPASWTLAGWQRQIAALSQPALNTLWVALASTVIALALTVACLENEATLRRRERTRGGSLWLLYLPLLVPQLAFLFGAQVLLVRAGLDGTLAAVVWAHLVFVLPYLFLSLADPWRAFDARYTRTAASLGASRWRAFWRIKLPILLRPVAIACAVAFAVSVGEYLPTVFAGAGRVATLTTEAVTLSAGADRRVIGVWALLQALFPLAAFALALALPRFVHAGRRGMA